MYIYHIYRTSLGDAINGAITSCATPLLNKVLPMVFGPMLNVHIQGYRVLRDLYDHAKQGCIAGPCTDEEEYHRIMRSTAWNIYWDTSDVARSFLDPMCAALTDIGSFSPFNFLNPSALKQTIIESVRQLLHDAVYTLEKDPRCVEALSQGGGAVAETLTSISGEISDRYFQDSRTQVKETMGDILWILIGTPIQKTVLDTTGVSAAISAAEDMIQEDLKDFMSINDTFEELLRSILQDVINEQVDSNSAACLEKLQNGHETLL